MTDEQDDAGPAGAFSVLGDETRVAIIEALAEAEQADEEGLSFSELRKRVGVRDAGQFNYHLSKLQSRFVVKRDDGYHPRLAALRAVGAIRSGTYTDRPTTETSETDFDCPECGATLTATYENALVQMKCPEHGVVFETGVPPRAAVDRSVQEIVEFADIDTQRDVERAVDGTCHICWGRVTPNVSVSSGDGRVYAKLDCEDCWLSMTMPVGGMILRHPAMVSFYYDHGIDVRQRPYLSLDFIRESDNTTVVSRDPVRIRVTTELDGDSLAFTVDGDLNVLEVEES
ncbi:ArsR family transcriptional regulator [Halobacteriales archaeon SW_6_65_15]|jgi:DNA-binding transcriptional ArsR family regulator|nr:MAG: ArsR family transcriptional regulator [Halobacteriales archaeon SW_6_65_15]